MPSTTLQSKINFFEALESASTASFPVSKSQPDLLGTPISPTTDTFQPIIPLVANLSSGQSRSSSPPRLGRKTSLIDLKDWVVEDGPFSTPPSDRQTLSGGEDSRKSAPSTSNKTLPTRKQTPSNGVPQPVMPLINFESPPKQQSPFPPGKPSRVSAAHCHTLHAPSMSSDPTVMLGPSSHSGSLANEHTYPPISHQFGTGRLGHAPASSISSFHSVSLSSEGNNLEVPSLAKPSSSTDTDNTSLADMDSASIAESFEDVSVPSAISPSTAVPFDWEAAVASLKITLKPSPPRSPSAVVAKAVPLLPPRPLARSSSRASTTSVMTRRIPPPLPSLTVHPRSPSLRTSFSSTSASSSDRSSTLSTATTTSKTSISTHRTPSPNLKVSSLHRPTPVPPSVRVRYEALFTSALLGQRQAEKQSLQSARPLPIPKARKIKQAVGWRDISLDTTVRSRNHIIFSGNNRGRGPAGDSNESDKPTDAPERLNGCIVKYIWRASRLDRRKLRAMWNDCDPEHTGYLDRDAFVKGMWLIDEELRRVMLAHRASALTAASSQRIPHRPVPRNGATPRSLS